MLDINLFREEKGNDPEIIRESQRRRLPALISSMRSSTSTKSGFVWFLMMFCLFIWNRKLRRRNKSLLTRKRKLVMLIKSSKKNWKEVGNGGRGYFLRGYGVLLNQALINFGLALLTNKEKKEFTLLQPPFFMRKDVMAKCAQLEDFDNELYKVFLEL